MHNKYQQAVEKIQTPPELKEKTRRLLQAQTAKKGQAVYVRWAMGTVAAAIVFVVGLSIWLGTGENDLIVSDLPPGQRVEVVVLQDGALYFFDLTTEDFVPPLRLSPAFPLRRNLPLEDYPGVLPSYIPDGFSPPEGGITAYFSDPLGDAQAIVGRAVYQGENGETLSVTFTDNPSLLPLPFEVEGSQIAGITVGVGFSETIGSYYGAFLKDGYLFLLSAQGLEQREFVNLLHHFVSY